MIKSSIIYILIILTILIAFYLISVPAKTENFMIVDVKERLSKIDPTFSRFDIREGETAYTEDKTTIYLCLNDENGKPYPMNTLLYVALHEISHVLNTKSYGHDKNFSDIFDKLLCRAARLGVYDPNSRHPEMYAGVNISSISMPECSLVEAV